MKRSEVLNVLRRSVSIAFMCLAASVARAQVIDHSAGFDPHGDLTANGDASFPTGTTVARITRDTTGQKSSLFFTEPVCVNSFATSFNFLITVPFGLMADGMTFTIQGRGPTAIGGEGGGLGYGRDFDADLIPDPAHSINNSVAIKIDFWNNHSETDNSTGLFTNGRTPTISKRGWVNCEATGCNPLRIPDRLVPLDKRSTAAGGSGIDFKSRHKFKMDLTYDGAALTETVTDTVTGDAVTIVYRGNGGPLDIPAIVGGSTGWVGFTGGTGGIGARQDIFRWTYQCPAPTT